jgi:DNA helicase-2/ATP-dependent DNA helicase PcrA
MRFNVDQQVAIDTVGNLLILAPPGSGKTGTLVQKTATILKSSPKAIVGLVTFTDAATKELSHRLEQSLSKEEFKRIKIHTFHKHLINQMREAKVLGRLLTPPETIPMILRAISASGRTMTVEEGQAELEAAKLNENFTGRESDLIESYEEQRRRHRAHDLWDVVREGVVGMRQGSVPLLKATHILADEFQDTDPLQLSWLLIHQKAGAEVTVVGDDDQSVYGWRRAMGYEGMEKFAEEADATRVVLQINYRSRKEILDAAAAVIKNNAKRVQKNMLSSKGPGGTVFVRSVPSSEKEAELIANAVIEDTQVSEDGVYRPGRGRWAVICRTNAGMHMVAAEMRVRGVSYVRVAGKDKLPDLARVLCQLLASVQTGDALGIESGLLTAGVSDYAMKVLQQTYEDSAPATIHSEQSTQIYRLLDGEVPEDMKDIPPEEVKTIRTFARLGRVWRARAMEGFYNDVITGVENWLQGFAKEYQLPDLAFWAQKLKNGNGSLSARSRRALDYEAPKDGTGVALHTMHSCKGLEFDRVVVIGCNQGTIPSSKSESVDEERRLFFVAMTRARDELTMTYSSSAPRSQFISEMGTVVDLPGAQAA